MTIVDNFIDIFNLFGVIQVYNSFHAIPDHTTFHFKTALSKMNFPSLFQFEQTYHEKPISAQNFNNNNNNMNNNQNHNYAPTRAGQNGGCNGFGGDCQQGWNKKTKKV